MFNKVARAGELAIDAIKSRYSRDYQLNDGDRGEINFIDVGSVGGLPEPWRQNAFRIAFLLNFEPNGPITRGNHSMTYNTALWNDSCELDFYVYRGNNSRRSGSSLFEQNFDYVTENFETLSKQGPPNLAKTWHQRSETIDTKKMICKPLDVVLKEELGGRPFHFTKIDAQGAEYEILSGAKEFLSTTCVGMELELFRVPLYKNIRLVDEVTEFLAGFGFSLAKKFPPHGTFDSQNNCVFIHDERSPELQSIIRDVYGIS